MVCLTHRTYDRDQPKLLKRSHTRNTCDAWCGKYIRVVRFILWRQNICELILNTSTVESLLLKYNLSALQRKMTDKRKEKNKKGDLYFKLEFSNWINLSQEVITTLGLFIPKE